MSVNKQMNDLKDSLYKAVENAIIQSNCDKIAIAFSGGVDSTLLAKICSSFPIKILLITVGFERSHDILFSKKIAELINLPYKSYLINSNEFVKDVEYISNFVNVNNNSHIENCIAFYYLAKISKYNNIDVIFTANGCDELFCGYDRYRSVYNLGKNKIQEFMIEKIKNEFILIDRINKITRLFNITTKQPFLSDDFIKFANTIPIELKIYGEDDHIRKHVLRNVAKLIGVPNESADKPKKAIQYGSGINKELKKIKKMTERRISS